MGSNTLVLGSADVRPLLSCSVAITPVVVAAVETEPAVGAAIPG